SLARQSVTRRISRHSHFGDASASSRVVSREPVIYVRNILKYYTSYTLYRELAEASPKCE
ncbi:MAG: hypothetical protein AAFV62_13980, partial [Pseudomonadota bacterium]